MTISMATISGSFVRPDLGAGAMTIYLEAATEGSRLTASGVVVAGKYAVVIASDGTASVTIPQLPQVAITPADARWRLVMLVGKSHYAKEFTLSADTTWSSIVDVSTTVITSSILAAALAAVASVKIGTWQATTAYVSAQTVQAPDGSLIKATASRTSRASFDATEQTFWTPVSTTAGTLEQLALDANYTTMRAPAGDATAALNTFLAATTVPGPKRLVGAFTISGSVTVPAGVYVDATGAAITTSLTTTSSIILGAGSTWKGGSITGPASWDGTNTAAAMVFAMMWVNGNNVVIDDVDLTNIYKVGIGIKDHDDVTVTGCHMIGNYPSGSWTGVETNHYAINSDPDAAGANLVITGNTIESCVQGVFIGNFGAGVGIGAAITGNLFEGCWNHGVYGYGNAYSVAGNSFNQCQIPIALSGNYHSVVGNSIYTPVSGGTDQRDITGISMRDSIGCSVVGNTIKGNAANATNIISFSAVDGVIVRDNVCADNIVDITGTNTSNGIAIGTGATTCDNNDVHDNDVRVIGRANLGSIICSPSATGIGNKIHHNTIVITGNSSGIFLTNNDGAMIDHNHIRVEFDSGSAITIGGVTTSTNTTRTKISHNEFRVSSAWGTNITFRAIQELTGSTSGRYTNNEYLLDPTKLAVGVTILTLSGSNALVNEALAGAPALLAAPGSMVRRTDGGASTTLYVKETASTSTTWRAV